MDLAIVLVLLLCPLFPSLGGAQVTMELTDDTFDEVIQNESLVLVEFYASWCVFCHNLDPILSGAAQQLVSHDILLAKVNIEQCKRTQARFDVKQLPLMMIFRNGLSFHYDGPDQHSISVESLVQYMLTEKNRSKTLAVTPVMQLTEENFDEVTQSLDLILVGFFVDQCLPCKQLEPHFLNAARTLLENKPPVQLATLDVPKSMEVAKRYGIGNYPLLLMFRYGKAYNYTGPKEEEGIVRFMKNEAGPSSYHLTSLIEFKQFKKSHSEPIAIGFFSESTSNAVVEAFVESGNYLRQDLKLAHITDASIAEELLFPVQAIVVFHHPYLVSKFEAGYSIIHDIEGDDGEELSKRFFPALRPLVGQMTKANMFKLYHQRPLLVAYFDVKWDKESYADTKYWHSTVTEVASQYMDGDLIFAVADEEEFAVDLHSLGLVDWGEEVAVGIFAPGPLKYAMKEEFNVENLKQFVDNFHKDVLIPYYASEPPPKKGKGPVKTIVGSTFEDIVYSPTKDVVVMLCGPKVKECKQASTWFQKAADRFYKKQKNVIFGDINVELNDVPLQLFKLDGLPTFFFSPRGSSGEESLVKIQPVPESDTDLLRWMRKNFDIKPPSKDISKKKKPREEL